jgi:polysaccharide biosynthesis/export protein
MLGFQGKCSQKIMLYHGRFPSQVDVIRHTEWRKGRFAAVTAVLLAVLPAPWGWTAPNLAVAQAETAQAQSRESPSAPTTGTERIEAAESLQERELQELGGGDQISITVYGQADMESTVYVGDDGAVNLPLVGAVKVGGLTSVVAARHIEQALKNGQFFVDPHVTVTLLQAVSRRVSILGAIHTPGRYPIAPNMTLFDLLAQAGGVNDDGAATVDIERVGSDGQIHHYEIDLDAGGTQTLQSRDKVFVPPAPQYFIYGEVASPGRYRIETGMTVIQAIARSGGITPRGSERRVEIKRLNKDGTYLVIHAKAGEPIEPADVIRVKEGFF